MPKLSGHTASCAANAVGRAAGLVPVRPTDKELAEQKAEELQQEVEDLKVRLEEAMLELELAKSGDGTEEGGAGGASSAQVEQLEKQNNLLKEALVKVRPIKHVHWFICHGTNTRISCRILCTRGH